MKDWEEFNQYDETHQIIYSPDWKSFSFIAEKDWKWFVVKDWEKGEEYDKIDYIRYSSDGKEIAYSSEKDWKKIIVKDWKELNNYDSQYSPQYSPDWKSFSYIVNIDWKKFLLKDWKIIDELYSSYSYISKLWDNNLIYKKVIRWDDWEKDLEFYLDEQWKKITKEHYIISNLRFLNEKGDLVYSFLDWGKDQFIESRYCIENIDNKFLNYSKLFILVLMIFWSFIIIKFFQRRIKKETKAEIKKVIKKDKKSKKKK